MKRSNSISARSRRASWPTSSGRWSNAFPRSTRSSASGSHARKGDVGRLVAEARREIRNVTSETAWQDEWTGEGYIPDYSKIRHRFERLLELGHADDVVSLGREFITRACASSVKPKTRATRRRRSRSVSRSSSRP